MIVLTSVMSLRARNVPRACADGCVNACVCVCACVCGWVPCGVAGWVCACADMNSNQQASHGDEREREREREKRGDPIDCLTFSNDKGRAGGGEVEEVHTQFFRATLRLSPLL